VENKGPGPFWKQPNNGRYQVNVNYDSTSKYTPIPINMTLNWDTEAESVKRVSDHVYFKVLNELAHRRIQQRTVWSRDSRCN
jgi:hypothetical protein